MNRNRAITLIIVLNFMIMLLHGLNYHMTNPTEINRIIASTYKTPANKAFTDQNFYNCVINGYNSENNTSLAYTTNLSKNQLASIQVINCDESSVKSTNGLDLLTGLKKLYASKNEFTNIDISKNTNLEVLIISSNKLTSLDVSNNVNLTYVDIYNNELTSLDISKNTKLTYLLIHRNELTSLDTSENTELTELSIYDNKLTNLDVSKSIKLNKLDISLNDLTSIDVSKNTNLTSLNISINKLTSIDVSKNTNLTYLNTSGNLLTNLDVSNNINLIYLESSKTLLTDLDVSKNTKLEYLDVSDNRIILFDEDHSGNGIISLDVSNNINLKELYASGNQLTNLDVSKNTNLTSLVVSKNQLTSLDVGKNTNLKVLEVNQNQLTSLDVSKNPNLEVLYISQNQLTNLDISKNIKLSKLSVSDNQLTNLDISRNTKLTKINVDHNQLTNLDVSKNINLTNLNIYDNELTSLDISKNTKLTTLYDYDNPYVFGAQIVYKNTELDLSTKINSYSYKLNSNFAKKFKYIELKNYGRLDSPIIKNENKGLYVYTIFLSHSDDSGQQIKFSSGIYTICVTELTSDKYIIDEDKEYIYTGADTDKDMILSNLKTTYGTVEINNNKVQVKNKNGVIKEFDIIDLSSSKYIIDEEKEYIYTGFDTDKNIILNNLKTTYGTVEINDNKVQLKNKNNVLKEFKILNLKSSKYKLNSDYIYIGTNEFSKYDITTECALNLKDNSIEVRYDSELLDIFKQIRVTSSKYKITDKYIYAVGEISLSNINITNGNIKINNNKLEVTYNDSIVDNLDILSISFGNLKVSNNMITSNKNILYKDFTKEITPKNVAYKIYKEDNEVTSGEVEEGMTLKVISDKYGIIEEYKITSEHIDVSKLNIDENNFINDFEIGNTYEKILDKIDTSGEIKIIDNVGKELTDNDIVRTGSKIRIELNAETKEYTVVVLGDVTGTGKITMADVMKTANYLLDNSVIKEECYKKAADVTKDGNIKISDVMKLANYVLNGKF